jgi:hypothetical protein
VNYFQDFSRVVQTKSFVDKDLYGKPGMIYLHEGGVQAMAADLKTMLSGDFAKNLNKKLYEDNIIQPCQPRQAQPVAQISSSGGPDLFRQAAGTPDGWQSGGERVPQTQAAQPEMNMQQQPVMSLYDLFGIPEEERNRTDTKRKTGSRRAGLAPRPQRPGLSAQPQNGAVRTNAGKDTNPKKPARKRDKGIREKYPNALALIPDGDRYVATGEDAVRAARILGLALFTEKGTQKVSFPSRALDTNLPLLVKAGQRVAVAGEPETPGTGKRQAVDMTQPRPRSGLSARPQVQPDMAGHSAGADSGVVYPVLDARKEELEQQRRELEKPRSYSGALQEHHKQGSLVAEQNGQTGFLKERYRDAAVFKSLELNSLQEQKAKLYIEIRDTYHSLYSYEAKERKENADLRQLLNQHYDAFVKRYGNLNDRKNLDLVKMDTGGHEILSLEHFDHGKSVKADIFNQPVAFNPNETARADTSLEALSASLNKSGKADMEYMLSLLPDKSREEMIEELHGRIYYNPLVSNYETSDRFIAGNVIEKAEALEQYLTDSPQDENARAVSESLKALKDAAPRPITFEELDFNFGERWIPSGVYSRYAEHLFKVKTGVSYAPNSDEYSVRADYRTIAITDKYAVQGEFRRYDGVALLKHALHNTTPNISKSARATDREGKEITVKVRDGEKIQLANSKIDEIRTDFAGWLNILTSTMRHPNEVFAKKSYQTGWRSTYVVQ